jgi:hypothetical protein
VLIWSSVKSDHSFVCSEKCSMYKFFVKDTDTSQGIAEPVFGGVIVIGLCKAFFILSPISTF